VQTRAELLDRLADVGLMRDGDGLVTAAEALAAQAVRLGVREAAVVGEAGLVDALRRAGVTPVPADDAWRQWRTDRTHVGRAVTIGLAPGTNIRTLGHVATLLECPLPLLATTAEVAYPTEEGMSAGTGMVLAALASRLPIDPILCGKPSTSFLDAVQRIVSGRVLVVGDTTEADVELAAIAGWDSLLVLTGTSAAETASHDRATYVLTDLTEITNHGL
jgi:ribonucleotide monophosphatase NagD (HAD superfamily)